MQSQNVKISVLFVCAGNTCRSPMAKGLAQNILGDGHYIESAGIDAAPKISATQEAIQTMMEQGIDIKNHLSLSLEHFALSHWNIVVAMTPRIADIIKATKLISADRIITWNVSDPYGENLETYKNCAENIKKLIPSLIADSSGEALFASSEVIAINKKELVDYVKEKLDLIESGKVNEGSHLDGIVMTSLRMFEIKLKSEFARNLEFYNLTYEYDIKQYIKGETLFDKLTLGNLVFCYRVLIENYNLRPKIQFKGNQFKNADFSLINRINRIITSRRNKVVHNEPIDVNEAIKVLREIKSIIN